MILKRSLLKISWEKEQKLVTSIFSFPPPPNFYYPFQNKFKLFSHLCFFKNALNLDHSQNLSFDKEFNLAVYNTLISFPNKPWFYLICSTILLETLWTKEKLLITSNFSFAQVFSTCQENSSPF